MYRLLPYRVSGQREIDELMEVGMPSPIPTFAEASAGRPGFGSRGKRTRAVATDGNKAEGSVPNGTQVSSPLLEPAKFPPSIALLRKLIKKFKMVAAGKYGCEITPVEKIEIRYSVVCVPSEPVPQKAGYASPVSQ